MKLIEILQYYTLNIFIDWKNLDFKYLYVELRITAKILKYFSFAYTEAELN